VRLRKATRPSACSSISRKPSGASGWNSPKPHARTQEFTLRWSEAPHGSFTEIARQQYNFSPRGSTREVEDYQVRLNNVSVLELTIKPELDAGSGIAALSRLCIA
jgi:hypothetical protein